MIVRCNGAHGRVTAPEPARVQCSDVAPVFVFRVPEHGRGPQPLRRADEQLRAKLSIIFFEGEQAVEPGVSQGGHEHGRVPAQLRAGQLEEFPHA